MRMYLISDNTDTLTGMRLAGVDGVIANEKETLEKALNDQLQALILETQRMGADVIGFSRLARQTHYQWYQNQGRPWSTAFRAAEFPMTVKVTLKRGGHVQ